MLNFYINQLEAIPMDTPSILRNLQESESLILFHNFCQQIISKTNLILPELLKYLPEELKHVGSMDIIRGVEPYRLVQAVRIPETMGVVQYILEEIANNPNLNEALADYLRKNRHDLKGDAYQIPLGILLIVSLSFQNVHAIKSGKKWTFSYDGKLTHPKTKEVVKKVHELIPDTIMGLVMGG